MPQPIDWSQIKAVTFDVGGTLIEPWPSVGHVYAQVAERFGFAGVDPGALTSEFLRAWRGRAGFDYSRPAWRQLVNQSFLNATGRAPERECFDAIYEYFGTAATWRVFDDVLPTLQRLRTSGRKLGIISNWDERLTPLLDQLHLSPLFDVSLISHEAGCTKPAPAIFLQTAQLLKVTPGSIVHIGDSHTEDVAGATAAGMHSLLLERNSSGAQPSVISSLSQIAG